MNRGRVENGLYFVGTCIDKFFSDHHDEDLVIAKNFDPESYQIKMHMCRVLDNAELSEDVDRYIDIEDATDRNVVEHALHDAYYTLMHGGEKKMTPEEALDVIDDLMNDVWDGAEHGRPIYVNDADYEALGLAKAALEEKFNG